MQTSTNIYFANLSELCHYYVIPYISVSGCFENMSILNRILKTHEFCPILSEDFFFFFLCMSVFKIAFLIASQIYFYSDFQNTHNFNFIGNHDY